MKAQIASVLLLWLSSVTSLCADNPWSQTRSATLLGTLNTPLAVEPAIPSSYVAMSKHGVLDAHDWIYWGPKEAVSNYFKDHNSLSQAIIRVKVSELVTQTGPDSFSKENDSLAEAFAPLGFKRMYDVKRKWGRYPVYVIAAQFETKWLYAAWVGLDDAAGTTLMFELVYPGSAPSEQDFAMWNAFLSTTKMLSAPLGTDGFSTQYLRGETKATLYGNALKLVGEQRLSDKVVQVVIDPKNSGYTVTLKKISYEFLPPGSSLGGPAVKVQGRFESKDGQLAFDQTIPVVVKPVASFSLDADEAKKSAMVVYQEKLPAMVQEYIGVN